MFVYVRLIILFCYILFFVYSLLRCLVLLYIIGWWTPLFCIFLQFMLLICNIYVFVLMNVYVSFFLKQSPFWYSVLFNLVFEAVLKWNSSVFQTVEIFFSKKIFLNMEVSLLFSFSSLALFIDAVSISFTFIYLSCSPCIRAGNLYHNLLMLAAVDVLLHIYEDLDSHNL